MAITFPHPHAESRAGETAAALTYAVVAALLFAAILYAVVSGTPADVSAAPPIGLM